MSNYQVFISYKRDPDADAAEKIFNELDSKGYVTFLDRKGLEGGSRFPDRIKTAIESARLFVLLLSKTTLDSEWVNKELEIAVDRAKNNSLIIVPVIVDSTPLKELQTDILNYVIESFTFLECDKMPDWDAKICDILEANGIYPLTDFTERIIRCKKDNDAIQSIPTDIRRLLKECKECPRRCSDDTYFQCPLYYPSRKPDDVYLEDLFDQGLDAFVKKNLKNNPEPLSSDFPSEEEYQSAVDWWNEEMYDSYITNSNLSPFPEDRLESFECKVGAGHIVKGNEHLYICQKSYPLFFGLAGKIQLLRRPLYQSDLLSFEKAFEKLRDELNDNDWPILDKLGLKGLFPFVSIQLSRAWSVKKDNLLFLVKKKGLGSLESLLSYHLNLASESIRNAIIHNAIIPKSDYFSFYLIWWLLRNNSCLLTYSLISQDSFTDVGRLISALGEFRSAYKSLSSSETSVSFEIVLNNHGVDFPEEMDSLGTGYIGCSLSDYDWLSLKKVRLFRGDNDEKGQELSFIRKTAINECHNPSMTKTRSKDGSFYGLSRGSTDARGIVQSAEIEYLDGEKVNAGILKNVSAVDYLTPVSRYCDNLTKFLKRKKKDIIVFSSIHYLEYKEFHISGQNDFLNYFYSNLAKGEDVTLYDTIVYDVISPGFKQALHLMERGETERGIELLELSAEKNDLNSIVYLANLYAYGPRPDYEKALLLYEKAASRGVCFTLFNIAQCYELLQDYRQAYWWYLVLLGDDRFNQEEINLRLGNCCRRLGDRSYYHFYFNEAGRKGSAAEYLLNYSDNDKCSFNGYNYSEVEAAFNAFNKALNLLIEEVQPGLGVFQDLDNNDVESNSDTELGMRLRRWPNPAEREELEQKTTEGDPYANFILGLFELKDYIASEEFIKKALNRIKNAAVDNNPYALCYVGLYMKKYKKDDKAARVYFDKALKALYPAPFPDLLRME